MCDSSSLITTKAGTSPPRNTAATKDFDKMPVRFLDLHPELRNRVYELAATRDEISVINRRSKREFFSFTQTCRQIRAEFRPMYLQTRTLHVYLHTAIEAVKILHPGYIDPEANKTTMLSELVVHVDLSSAHDWTEHNMVHLLGLIREVPGLRLLFKSENGEHWVLQDLFDNATVSAQQLRSRISRLKMDHCCDCRLYLSESFEAELKSEGIITDDGEECAESPLLQAMVQAIIPRHPTTKIKLCRSKHYGRYVTVGVEEY